MKCIGNFKIKSLTKKNGGEFTNDKGQVIKYKESFVLKVDEQTENGIFERIFKVSADSPLISQLNGLKPYDDIVIEFDVALYSNRISLIPIALVK